MSACGTVGRGGLRCGVDGAGEREIDAESAEHARAGAVEVVLSGGDGGRQEGVGGAGGVCAAWGAAARARFEQVRGKGGAWAERVRGFRAEIGLPTGRPVVMTGHQAEWWHPGILAKAMAVEAAARAAGGPGGVEGRAAWLIVDQDTNEDRVIRLPVLDRADRLSVLEWVLGGAEAGGEADEDVPTARRAAFGRGVTRAPALPDGARWGTAYLATGETFEGVMMLLDRHAGVASRAEQVALVLRDWAGLIGGAGEAGGGSTEQAPALVFASGLAATGLVREVVERMVREPRRCVEMHNAAARAHPEAGIAALAMGAEEEKIELPLWHVGSGMGSKRGRVTVGLARRVLERSAGELLPRAVLATGLMRLAGADVFVHGLGGRLYDRVSEAWLGAWLADWWDGERGIGLLAPSVVASATARLTIDFAEGRAPASAESLARLRWLGHHARHNPLVLGDRERAAAKAEILARLRALRARRRRDAGARAESARLYRALQGVVAESRERHAADLARLDELTAGAKARARESAIAADRTWFFGLHERGRMEELRARVRAG